MKNKIFALACIFMIGCNMPKDKSGNFSLENDADMIVYGKNIYIQFCQQCHGENGIPSSSAGFPDLTKTSLDNEDDISNIVFHGKNAMPSFQDKIEEAQIKAVSMYVLSLKKK
jgi:mono/diheme cytochrome c family protein